MTDEEFDIQKEIEKYFTESTGFGRDKLKNFMDIVNKALQQKGERIEELEQQIEKMKCCANCNHKKSEIDRCELLMYTMNACLCKNKDKWELRR